MLLNRNSRPMAQALHTPPAKPINRMLRIRVILPDGIRGTTLKNGRILIMETYLTLHTYLMSPTMKTFQKELAVLPDATRCSASVRHTSMIPLIERQALTTQHTTTNFNFISLSKPRKSVSAHILLKISNPRNRCAGIACRFRFYNKISVPYTTLCHPTNALRICFLFLPLLENTDSISKNQRLL